MFFDPFAKSGSCIPHCFSKNRSKNDLLEETGHPLHACKVYNYLEGEINFIFAETKFKGNKKEKELYLDLIYFCRATFYNEKRDLFRTYICGPEKNGT